MKEINGDIKLSKAEQVQYLLQNLIRGLWGYRILLNTKFWRATSLDLNTDSPGRQYLNAFFREEFPKILSKKDILVLDIGCGTGYIRNILENLGYFGRYTGVDVMKEEKFSDQSEKFKIDFVQKPIEDFETNQNFDLVISNTSFEHIPDDFKAARQADKYAGSSGLQIHIVPAFWSLPIYLLHGYRQYNPERVCKIFSENKEVYRLGGVFTFLLYFFLATIPERLTGKMLFRKTKFYPKFLSFANRADKILPFMSTFYIVIIKPKNGKNI